MTSAPDRQTLIPTPGARVVVRDAEWIVRRVDHAPGGYQIVCDGVSELVRGREAFFLTALEPAIEVLDPAKTRLVPDDSAQFTDSILYMESQLRQAVPNDAEIHVGHTAAMDLVPYQLDPARLALARPRQRILIADAVGLGKTLEAGILVSELIARGRGRRILVLAVKSMLTQFQKEFWNRFTIPLTRLDSIGIQRVRSRIPTNYNPFYYYDNAIISIDTLKQDAEYRTYLEEARWDIIVIDEAHNVADRGTGSLRSRLAKLLAKQSDTLIMLSATPHDGKARSFASLVNMLDATAITDPEHYTKDDFRPGLVIRRFKKDVQEQVREAFSEREVCPRQCRASEAEEAAYDALLAVQIAGYHSGRASRDLFAVTLEKALFSSPAACIETLTDRTEPASGRIVTSPSVPRSMRSSPLKRQNRLSWSSVERNAGWRRMQGAPDFSSARATSASQLLGGRRLRRDPKLPAPHSGAPSRPAAPTPHRRGNGSRRPSWLLAPGRAGFLQGGDRGRGLTPAGRSSDRLFELGDECPRIREVAWVSAAQGVHRGDPDEHRLGAREVVDGRFDLLEGANGLLALVPCVLVPADAGGSVGPGLRDEVEVLRPTVAHMTLQDLQGLAVSLQSRNRVESGGGGELTAKEISAVRGIRDERALLTERDLRGHQGE